MPLPTGTVTFLFTDIEGSTRLWEEHPDAMREALAKHDEAMGRSFESAGGHVFKTIGDAFCVAFETATDAVTAACNAQRALAVAPSDLGPLPVRMALYTGEAEARDDDYFGPALNRCARILNAAHGGQIILSNTTAGGLAGEALSEGLQLESLGRHRLRDLTQPQELLQLSHPDLPSDFPPLRSLVAFTHNLPAQTSELIGRESEIAKVREILASTRLLTLTGSGGAGKTRLALQVGAEMLDEYPDGVWFIELAAISDAGLVPQALLSTLGVREQPQKTGLEAATEALRDKHVLLIMDNCEHLIDACADLAGAVLATCPDVNVLATSRETLRTEGEVLWRVPSLPVPEQSDSDPIALTQFAATRLFIERAQAVKPDFLVTDDTAPTVVEICHRLDGIPLAIELAAARTRLLSVDQIEKRLDDRFRLLTGGRRTALPRHQALRAAVEWSYDLLDERERMLYERLSVFVGGFTLEAAEAVCAGGDTDEGDVLDLLSELVDKSLVVSQETEDGTRHRMLESLRAYGEEKLEARGDAGSTRRAHAQHYSALATLARPHLSGPAQGSWLGLLEADHGNLRTSLHWGTRNSPNDAGASACALERFWTARGLWHEGREFLGRLVAMDKCLAEPVRADVLLSAAGLALRQGALDEAEELLNGALPLYESRSDHRGVAHALYGRGVLAHHRGALREAEELCLGSLELQMEIGDDVGVARSLHGLGLATQDQGDHATARDYYERSLELSTRLGDTGTLAVTLNNLGNVARTLGDPDEAMALHERSLGVRRELGDKAGAMMSLHNIGLLAEDRGDHDAAQGSYMEALALARQLGDQRGEVIALRNLAGVCQARAEYARAREIYAEALRAAARGEHRFGIASCLEGLAVLEWAEGKARNAAKLFGMAACVRDGMGTPVVSFHPEYYAAQVDATKAALGRETFDAAWAEGLATTLDEAVAYALGDVGEPDRDGGPSDG